MTGDKTQQTLTGNPAPEKETIDEQSGFEQFGAANETDQDTRRLHPKDDQFVDARENNDFDAGEQSDLVTDEEKGQLNFSGERADAQSLW